MEMNTLGNGSITKAMALEPTRMQMELNIRANGKTINNMELVKRFGLTDLNTMENIVRE